MSSPLPLATTNNVVVVVVVVVVAVCRCLSRKGALSILRHGRNHLMTRRSGRSAGAICRCFGSAHRVPSDVQQHSAVRPSVCSFQTNNAATARALLGYYMGNLEKPRNCFPKAKINNSSKPVQFWARDVVLVLIDPNAYIRFANSQRSS